MLFTYAGNNAGYNPEYMWTSKKQKSVLVNYTGMAKSIGLNATTIDATISTIDTQLASRPVMFEWQGAKGWPKGYNLYHGVAKTKAKSIGESFTCCKQHWMVINGKNKDGTYTIFDPAGGKIRKKVTADHIAAGLNRICYVTK
jgi:hypothetical protein